MKKSYLSLFLILFLTKLVIGQSTIEQKILGTWVCTQSNYEGKGYTVVEVRTFQSSSEGYFKSEIFRPSGDRFSIRTCSFKYNIKKLPNNKFKITNTYGKITDITNGVETIDTKNSYKTLYGIYYLESNNVLIDQSDENLLRYVRD